MGSSTNHNVGSALKALLTSLDKALPPNVRATLRPPAELADLKALSAAFHEAASLPPEVLALLTWHDGQAWNSPLSKNNNRRLLSADEITQECSFFADPMSDFMEPWQASWLPLLTNDSGDFVVYETQGPLAGKLINYWHDDASRSVAYQSLAHWAEELLHEHANTDA